MKNKSDKNIMLVLPRIHNNVLPFIESLIELGYSVEIISLKTVPSILQERFNITRLKKSLMTKILISMTNFYRRERNELPGFYLPNLVDLFYLFYKHQPKYLVVRDRTITSYIFLLIGYLTKSKLYIYNQLPILNTKISYLFFKNVTTLSPVLYRADELLNIDIDIMDLTYGSKHISSFWTPFVVRNLEDLGSVLPSKRFNGTILCIARFEPYKNIELLVRAFNEIKNNYDYVNLKLVGLITKPNNNYFQKIFALVDSLSLRDVEFITDVEYQGMGKIYESGSIMVLTSYNDDASVAVAEALSHGIPVISSNSNGTACYIKDGYNGFVFENNSIEDLIAKLNYMISDCNYSEFSSNSIKFSSKYLSKDSFKEFVAKL